MSVKIGPVPTERGWTPNMKEIFTRKHHLDVVFICSNGSLSAHRCILAAESMFLKRIMLSLDLQEKVEILMPDVKLEHLKKAIKFMYTGKMTVTKKELYTDYTVWHVRKILAELIKIDNRQSLFNINVPPPPEDHIDDSPPDPPPPSGERPGSGDPNRDPDGSNSQSTSDQTRENESNNYTPEGGEFRQNKVTTVNEVIDEPVLPVQDISDTKRSRNLSESSDVEFLPTPRVPTPDIIDIIESDCEEIEPTAPVAERECEDKRNNVTSWPDRFGSEVVNENAEDDSVSDTGILIPKAPRLIPKSSDTDLEIQSQGDDVCQPINETENEKTSSETGIDRPIKHVRKKKKKRGRPKKKFDDPQILKARIKKEAPVAAVRPFNAFPPESSTSDMDFKLEPGKIVYRGKIINAEEKPKPTAPVKGVRTYNHNRWTLTGLKRLESLVAVKEEKALHECDQCDAVFEKYRSLQVHKDRVHNKNLTAKCPECGKMLSSNAAIKKHMLSHRPEEEWPHECPLCHKKFQARADIPKHLKTKMHENDDIPDIGTKEWFDLLYPEKAGHSSADMLVKVERQKEKEREKLNSLPKSLGVSVEEYDNWDTTLMKDDDSTTSHEKRKRKLVDASSDDVCSTPPRRQLRRVAAETAQGLVASLLEDEML